MQKPEKKIGQPEIHDEKPRSTIEARLRALLLYLTTGDEAMLEMQVEEALEADNEENVEGEDERLTEEEEKTQLRAFRNVEPAKISTDREMGRFFGRHDEQIPASTSH